MPDNLKEKNIFKKNRKQKKKKKCGNLDDNQIKMVRICEKK